MISLPSESVDLWTNLVARRLSVLVCVGVTIFSAQSIAQRGTVLEDEPHHNLLFENESIRVFGLELRSRTETLGYKCDYDCAIVPLADSTLSDIRPGGGRETLHLRKGDPQFFPAGSVHSLGNETGAFFRAVAVDMLASPSQSPPPPKCDCKPAGSMCGCGGGSAAMLIADGGGNWMHQRTEGLMTVRTYGLLPVATFLPKTRAESLPDFAIEAAPDSLLIAVDDANYRLGTSSHFLQLRSGTILRIMQKIWIRYPNPPTCSWGNFSVNGKTGVACEASVFVVLGPLTSSAEK